MLKAQQADSLDRVSSGIIATGPARKIPVDTRPVILGVGLSNYPNDPHSNEVEM